MIETPNTVKEQSFFQESQRDQISAQYLTMIYQQSAEKRRHRQYEKGNKAAQQGELNKANWMQGGEKKAGWEGCEKGNLL